STSLTDIGGSIAFVSEGNVRVGCPGAPGCTMTGLSLFCAVPDTAKTKTANKKPKPARTFGGTALGRDSNVDLNIIASILYH
ncbi:MAG: hypothetical protein ACRD43_12665, partial [Pyrinomonadaceae bacterium]